MKKIKVFVAASALVFGIAANSEAVPVYNPGTGHYYDTVTGNWFEAEAEAVAHGGHLLTINNAAEQAWIDATYGTTLNYWIGFNDAASEGNWQWVSGEAVTYTHWNPGEPNNWMNEDYAVTNWDYYGWNDITPYGINIGIAEWAAPSPSSEPRTYSLFIGMDDENINGSATVGKIYSAFLQNDIIQEEFAYVLKNENATKNNISLILDNLNLNDNDQFIFYYFGHGGTYETKIGFESTLSSGDEFLAIGTTADDYLSDNELTMLFQNEKWANVEKWFILDTCKSAGFWGNNNPNDSGDLEKLDNVALFAAASEDWYAVSTFVDSTGVFTNGWVAGLELNDGWAKADSNRDQQVSFEEWNLWLKQIDNWYDWRYNPYVYEQEVGDIHYIDSPEFFQFFMAKSEDFQGTFDIASSTVPEPSTILLFGSGLAGFAFLAHRKRS